MKKFLLGSIVAIALCLAPKVAQAQQSCIVTPASYSISAGFLFVPQCTVDGQLWITVKSGTVSVSFPYTGANGQTLQAASFLGIGGLDANGKFSPLALDASQNLLVKVNTALPTGSNVIGGVTQSGTWNVGQNGTWTVQPGNTQNTTPWLTAGGSTSAILTSASATACTSITGSATRLWSISNSGPATTVFPAFYKETGTACATGTAILGDASTITIGSAQTISFPGGLPLTGLSYKLSGALTAGQNLVIVTGPQ